VMDGLTAVREIRDAERAGTLSPQMVIALTGNARQGQIDQAMESGMDDGESHCRKRGDANEQSSSSLTSCLNY
jgi:CheY-like chemotaxis protein